MCVCYLCKLLNICDIQTGITDSLCKNQSGMLIDAVLYLLPVVVLDYLVVMPKASRSWNKSIVPP